jgi:hypothetical protein
MSKFREQIGKFDKVHDCIGLIKAYMWCDTPASAPNYSASQDVGAGPMRSLCKASRKMAEMPDTPGLLVFIGTGHVGVYIGGGQVIEARGSDYGIVQTALKSRPWDGWGRCPWLTYPDAAPAQKPAAGDFEVGDAVRVKAGATHYYPGGSAVPAWVKSGVYEVRQTTYGGKTVEKGGKRCVLLKGIATWCAIENITKV